MIPAVTTAFIITLDDDLAVAPILQAATGLPSRSFTSIADFQAAELEQPVAAFVDIHLSPVESGLDLLPELRSRWPYCPLIVMTSDQSSTAIGLALSAGADDFVRKPLDRAEVNARLRARAEEMRDRSKRETMVCGDTELNTGSGRIVGPAGESYLSPSEVRLLTFLIQSQGGLVTRDELRRKIWGTLKVSENALNKKLHDLRVALRSASLSLGVKSSYGTGVKLMLTPE